MIAAQLIYPQHALANTATLANLKFLTACFCGAVAGVLGLENQYGFALFSASSLITALAIYLVHIRGRSAKVSAFVRGGLWEFLNPGQENVFSFILVWTLFYGKTVQLVSKGQTALLISIRTGIVHGELDLSCLVRM